MSIDAGLDGSETSGAKLSLAAYSSESLPIIVLQVFFAAFIAARPISLSTDDNFSELFLTSALDEPSGVLFILWWFPFALCTQNGNKLMYI